MSDRFHCIFRIGGDVSRRCLDELLDAIVGAGVWKEGDGEGCFKTVDEVRGVLDEAIEQGTVLSLEDFQACYGRPGDLPAVCERNGIDYDLLNEAYGGHPADVLVFRGKRVKDGKVVRHQVDKWFLCEDIGGSRVTDVKELLEAIGTAPNGPIAQKKLRKLRERLIYPELTPIKLID